MKHTLQILQEIEKKGIVKRYAIRVVGLEYLLAIMIDTGRAKDHERVKNMLAEPNVNWALLKKIIAHHELQKKWEKVMGPS